MKRKKVLVLIVAISVMQLSCLIEYTTPKCIIAAQAKESESENPTMEVTGNFTEKSDKVIVKIKVYPVECEVLVIKDDGEPIRIIGDSYEISKNGYYKFVAIKDGKESYKEIKVTNITSEKKDKGKPEVIVNTNGYTEGLYTNKSIKVSLKSNESNSKVYFTDQNNIWHEVVNGEVNVEKNGVYELKFKAVSPIGIESEIKTLKLLIDKNKPSIDVTGNLRDKAKYVDLQIKKTCGISGVKSVTVMNGKDKVLILEDKCRIIQNGRYEFIITSNNGLSDSKVININNIEAENKDDDSRKQEKKEGEEKPGEIKHIDDKTIAFKMPITKLQESNKNKVDDIVVYNYRVREIYEDFNKDKCQCDKGKYTNSVMTGDFSVGGMFFSTVAALFMSVKLRKKDMN